MISPGPRHPSRNLGAGLVLRAMRPGDATELSAFVTRVFGLIDGEPDLVAGIWARELLRGDHPTSLPEDGTVVVDASSGRIVSCCFLIRQTWTYAGIPFAAGRPELIATEPGYRGRGLVRVQLDAVHAYGSALGHQMQAITGIPYFYRQFGYEPAIVTGGCRRIPVESIPPIGPGDGESIGFREAAAPDLSFIERMYRRAAERALIAAVRDEAIWRHELLARAPASDYWHQLVVIESNQGEPVGLLAFPPRVQKGALDCTVFEIDDGFRWEDVVPPALRYLRATGETIAMRTGQSLELIGFDWTPDHPMLTLAGSPLSIAGPPFAWYVRVEDIAGFVRWIAPALEARLARSPLAGYSGETTLTFYPTGLRFAFEHGRLRSAEHLQDSPHRIADAAFPGRTFLQLMLGARSIAELEQAFPCEAWVRREGPRRLLETLFPKLPSAVWPVA